MRCVANERDATLRADPRWERVTEDELPIHERVFGGRADDGVADGRPVRNRGNSFVDISRCGPTLFDVGVVLYMFSRCTQSAYRMIHLMRQHPTAGCPFLQRRDQEVHIRPQPPDMLILAWVRQESCERVLL